MAGIKASLSIWIAKLRNVGSCGYIYEKVATRNNADQLTVSDTDFCPINLFSNGRTRGGGLHLLQHPFALELYAEDLTIRLTAIDYASKGAPSIFMLLLFALSHDK